MIITLCGSSKFERHYVGWNVVLTMVGHTVFSLSAFPSQMSKREWYTDKQKELLDKAHFRKIDASDAALFLNVGAYMGVSTLNEWEYCKRINKRRYALESWGAGSGPSVLSPVDTFYPHCANLYSPELLGSSIIRTEALNMLEELDVIN